MTDIADERRIEIIALDDLPDVSAYATLFTASALTKPSASIKIGTRND